MAIPIINVSILNGNNGFRLDGAANDRSGNSVSNAGDVNGDGFDDVIVGAWGANPNGIYSGSSYVVFGKATGFDAAMDLSSLDGSNGFRLDGVAKEDQSGRSVSNAGDVNGDGFDDLIVGAQSGDSSGVYSGSSYVVFGKVSGFDATMGLSSLDGKNGFRLDGAAAGDGLGGSVSGAGDVNGDGFADLIVGARYADPNGNYSGSSYVVLGKATGFDAAMNLSSLNGSNGFRLDGTTENDHMGFSVSDAGDVNGDGFDDLIVSAPEAEPNGYRSGSSYVIFGKTSGFDAAMNLSDLNGNSGFRMNGEAERDFFGRSVSTAGDVNGDGFDDLIIGAEGADRNGLYSGSSYVVFGQASGFDATLDLSNLNGSNGFRLDGVLTKDGSGISVSSAGDFNGDGYDDLILGAVAADPNDNYYYNFDSGASYVVYGKASGFDAAMNLSKLDGSNGFRMNGVAIFDSLGYSVSKAGDVNGDGFDDLIIGAPSADQNGDLSGSSYVIFGGDFFSGEAVYPGTSGDDHLTGTSAAERFEAGDGNDHMTGFGGADVFHGDAGDDTIKVSDINFQLADGGVGNDTLELAGSGINLNLADFHNRINGIETIDMTGNGNNTLIFTLPDLLSLSDTTDTFTVNGNLGDRVLGLNDGWEDDGVDGDYRVLTNQGTVLRIDTSVRTDRPTPGAVILSNLDGSDGFRLDGVAAGDYSVGISNAGDVNGDGFDDVIVGASGADPNGSKSGSSYVVFGKASGFDAAMNLSNLDGNNGFRLDGVAASDFAGGGITGDVNGDGFDDVIMGASGADSNGSDSGSSYVVFGKTSGFDAAMNLSSLDGKNGFRLDGVKQLDRSLPAKNAGDINGDGFDDVIIVNQKHSYVVFGKTTGFEATQNLSSLDGHNGFRLDQDRSSEVVRSVSNAGDVNGDGYDDLIVGNTFISFVDHDFGYHRYSDISYIVFGKASGFDAAMNLSSLDGNNGFRLEGGNSDSPSAFSEVGSAGDVNGDGFDDVIISSYASKNYVVFGKASGFDATLNLSNLDGSNGFRLEGTGGIDRSVSTAGDVNGDGYDDFILGGPFVDSRDVEANCSYVVFGKASGFNAVMDLSDIDGTNGFRLVVDAQTPTVVSGAGDINGDGFDDLIVGDHYADPNGNNSGSTYVIFGRSDFSGTGVTHPGTPGNDNLIGTSAAEIFDAGDGNDNMIGRGGADVFHAGAGDDNIRVSDLSFQLVEGGTGNDALHLTGKDLNLDLSNFGDKISGIETICLYGSGDNTLTITAAGLLDLSDTTDTLKVNGNAGDHIVGLSSGWTDEGARGDGYFHAYTQGDAVLLVGANVTTDFV